MVAVGGCEEGLDGFGQADAQIFCSRGPSFLSKFSNGSVGFSFQVAPVSHNEVTELHCESVPIG